jgi:hypothetical protein
VPFVTIANVVAGAVAGFVFLATAVFVSRVERGFMDEFGWGNWPSGLALGPHGWLQQANFVVLGALTIAFALAVRRLSSADTARAGAALLAVAGAAAAMLLFKGDPHDVSETSWHAAVHVIALMGFVVTVMAGSFVTWRAVRREAWWRPTRRYSVAAAALLLPALALPDAESLGRYLLWFALLAPMTVIATRYLATARDDPARPR